MLLSRMEGDWLTFVVVCMYAQVAHLNSNIYQQGPPVAPPPVYQQQPPPRGGGGGGGGRFIEGWYVLPMQHQISFPHPNKLKSRNSNVLR